MKGSERARSSPHAARRQIILYLLEYDIPRLIIKLSANTLDVTYAENRFPKNLSAVSPLNPSVNKIDLIGYPQFALQNTLTSRIYEIQLNLAPAIEVSLWKGMQFTGQVIFPIKNDLGYEGDFIRPGFVTLAQEFRVRRRLIGRLYIAFQANRYGSKSRSAIPLRTPVGSSVQCRAHREAHPFTSNGTISH